MTPTSTSQPTRTVIIEEKRCVRKKKCHLEEECYIEVCYTLFSIEVIEFQGGPVGLVIKYRDRTMYLPPVVSSERITLPLKYSVYFDPKIFPEVKFRRWG